MFSLRASLFASYISNSETKDSSPCLVEYRTIINCFILCILGEQLERYGRLWRF
jgi:hypothetical protein